MSTQQTVPVLSDSPIPPPPLLPPPPALVLPPPLTLPPASLAPPPTLIPPPPLTLPPLSPALPPAIPIPQGTQTPPLSSSNSPTQAPQHDEIPPLVTSPLPEAPVRINLSSEDILQPQAKRASTEFLQPPPTIKKSAIAVKALPWELYTPADSSSDYQGTPADWVIETLLGNFWKTAGEKLTELNALPLVWLP